MTPAETLRAAGFVEDGGAWFRRGDGCGALEKDALAVVAAERAREDRALLATLAAGFAAGGATMADHVAEYARETFRALYGRAPEIAAPPADDAAAKVARVEGLLKDWRSYANAQRRAAESDGRGREAAAREASTYDAICKSIDAALAGKVTP